MRVQFGIEDGYVGNRPHYVDINDDDLATCETSEERSQMIEDAIEDYRINRISTYWDSKQLDRWEKDNEDKIRSAQEEQ